MTDSKIDGRRYMTPDEMKALRLMLRQGAGVAEMSRRLGYTEKAVRRVLARLREDGYATLCERTAARRAEALRLRGQGATAAAIAQRLGVSKGTVYRWAFETGATIDGDGQ